MSIFLKRAMAVKREAENVPSDFYLRILLTPMDKAGIMLHANVWQALPPAKRKEGITEFTCLQIQRCHHDVVNVAPTIHK